MPDNGSFIGCIRLSLFMLFGTEALYYLTINIHAAQMKFRFNILICNINVNLFDYVVVFPIYSFKFIFSVPQYESALT